jgi:tubulin monoglycylase TTLL3/8
MENIFREKIYTQIKHYVKASTLSVQDMVNNRKNSFEFFGYDFMVDEALNVWLIEVNSSPSMDTKDQPVLKKLVKSVM